MSLINSTRVSCKNPVLCERNQECRLLDCIFIKFTKYVSLCLRLSQQWPTKGSKLLSTLLCYQKYYYTCALCFYFVGFLNYTANEGPPYFDSERLLADWHCAVQSGAGPWAALWCTAHCFGYWIKKSWAETMAGWEEHELCEHEEEHPKP